MEKLVKEVVLTGGPCSGKTIIKDYLIEKLGGCGFRVFFVPEVATMFINNGVKDIAQIIQNNPEKYEAVERQILLTQLRLRTDYGELAKVFEGEKRVIIYDRGTMDVRSYVSEKAFQEMLKTLGIGLWEVRDSYDAVIHLVTAAKGAEGFYNQDNKARYEKTLQEAREADERTLKAWIGHPHLKVIDNSTGFERKKERVFKALARFLGIPAPLEIERKFLLARMPDLTHESLRDAQRAFIEQRYLIKTSDQKEESRIRKRIQGTSIAYYLTHKTLISAGIRQEVESAISARKYFELIGSQDLETQTVKKRRYYFIYKNQYFEMDNFVTPSGIVLLEIELSEANENLELPPFLEIEREVTDDPQYTNYALSKRRSL